MASVEGKLASLRRDDGYEAAQEAEEQSGAGAADRDGKPPSKPSMRREYHDLATLEPAPDDEEIFGAAWPLIVEWRKLLDSPLANSKKSYAKKYFSLHAGGNIIR